MAATTTEATAGEDEGPKYATFLDDPNNMAMYVVFPCLVFVYGGCASIYFCARLYRYCSRRRRQAQRKRLKNDDSDDDSNNNKKDIDSDSGSISIVDLTEPAPVVTNASTRQAQKKPVVARPTQNKPSITTAAQPQKLAEARTTQNKTAENRTTKNKLVKTTPTDQKQMELDEMTTANSKAAEPESRSTTNRLSSQIRHAQAVRPGYGEDSQYGMQTELQMKHLDDQLKAAFRLISSDEAKSKPDVYASADENTRPIKKPNYNKKCFVTGD